MFTGRLKECESARLFAQVTLAVHYLHQHGIAHRDIKALPHASRRIVMIDVLIG